MITAGQLRTVMPNLTEKKLEAYLPHLQAAMREFSVTGRLRAAAFLAQLAHESGELRYMEEIASGEDYEGRVDLGNTRAGDGRRYKGRGPIQLTGRANYRWYGKKLGLDLEGVPEQAARPEVGFRVAGLYWETHGLNALADAGDFETITRRINGGLRGLESRRGYYARALEVLQDDLMQVRLDGKKTPEVKAFLRDGRVWVALRPVASHYKWHIVGTSATEARLLPHVCWSITHRGGVTGQARGEHKVVPMMLLDGIGYVPARDLALAIHLSLIWDDAAKELSLHA